MSTSTFHARDLVVIVLALTFLVGWKGAKDWVQSSSAKDPTKLRASTKPVILPFPSPAVRNLEPAKPAKALEINETYGKLPLSFQVNQGQVDSEVRFLSRGRGYSLYLTSTEAVLQLPIDELQISNNERRITKGELQIPNFGFQIKNREPMLPNRHLAIGNRNLQIGNQKSAYLRMQLVGANPQAQVEGLEPLPGKSNYFLGNDPQKWRTHVPNYARVKYKEVYPGIDLVYYGSQQKLEYDWVVAPGADPKKIRFAFQGAKQIRLDPSGELTVETAGGEIRQHRPNVYQESNGSRTELEGGYVLGRDNQVQFEVARYDVTKPLIIDPVLVYSTFLGGAGNEHGHAIAVDALGNVYIAGSTESVDFPTLAPAQQTNRGNRDVFVSKLNPRGSALIYSTFLGGTDFEDSTGIAVDTAGNAHVTGYTMSTNFPVANALQPVSRGKLEGFVCKLSPTGSNLVYSTYLGGSGDDGTSNIAVDAAGNAHVTGYTISTDFPVANALQPSLKGEYDAFLSKLNPAGSALVYSTYLGGSSDDAALDLAVDASGNAYVVGWTTSTDFPTKNPLQPAHGGKGYYDAFVTKVNSAGTALVYSTYLGGDFHDIAWSVALDSSGNACLAGGTTSDNFPTVKPLQSSFGGGGHDAFVAKLDAAGASLLFSTFLGGKDGDEAHRIATDATGNIYVVGFSRSQDFPTLNSIKPRNLIGFDAFLAKLPPSGTSLVYSSLLGGSEDENCRAVAVDGQGNVYLAGNTSSSNFPTTNPLQAAYLGSGDAFVVKISGNPELTATVSVYVPIVLSAGGLNNSFYTSELTLTNRGTTDAKLDFNYAAAFGGGSGQGSDVLRAGRQKIVPDAIDYLRSAGVPIPDTGGRGGTLSVTFSGLSSYTDAAVTVRTTTALSDGRAGLSYSGIPHWNTLTGISYLCGLRQNSTDRSNVAVQHMGSAADRDLILSLTVFSGDPNAPFSQVLPDITLAPGGFYQISGILQSNGIALTNGFVKVERKSGNAPYYAYAVINDQVNSDGSFVPPVPDYSGSFAHGENLLVVPVVVENSRFSSELVLTNYSQQVTDLTVSSEGSPSSPQWFRLFTLQPGEQLIIPNIVQYLRDHSFSTVGLPGTDFVGPLFLRTFSRRTVFGGARTSTPGGGGWYGLFYPAITSGESLRDSAWLYGLQQNSENRTNLALVNTGEASGDTDLFNIELFDGESGQKVNTVEGVTLEATRWMQIGTILAQYAPGVTQGYAHVIRMSGGNPFIAYAVINDGGQPGERTDDGAFLASSP